MIQNYNFKRLGVKFEILTLERQISKYEKQGSISNILKFRNQL